MIGDAEDRVVTVVTAAPDVDVAERIGATLVEEGLVACANIVPGVTSIYRWEGSIARERETLIFMKTAVSRTHRLTERIVELHPYDLPEVIALPVEGGHDPYLTWVRSAVGSKI